MHDDGRDYGRDYGITLARVRFYLSMSLVPAPWERGAPEPWAQAWHVYMRYRQGKLRNTYL